MYAYRSASICMVLNGSFFLLNVCILPAGFSGAYQQTSSPSGVLRSLQVLRF